MMMGGTNTLRIADWLQHPLVREAIGQAPTGSFTDVATKLRDILNELEQRFPGLTFSEVVAASNQVDVRKLIGAMRWAGVAEREIDLVLGRRGFADRWPNNDHDDFTAAASNVRNRDLIAAGMTRKKAASITRLRRPPTALEQQALTLLFDGMSQHRVTVELGCDEETVQMALRKHRYRRWLSKQQEGSPT